MTQPFRIGFLLWPDLTQLDMTGPAQVPTATLAACYRRREFGAVAAGIAPAAHG